MLVGHKSYNDIEVVFTFITLLMTVGAFAYILNNISNILDAINR